MRALGCLLALLLCGCGSFDKHFFYPDSKVYQTPDRVGLKYEAVRIPSKGAELDAWFLPAVGEAQGTVVHLHGNAQNMTSHFSFVDWLPKAGFNLLVFDYRGYGQSTGTPTRDGLLADSLATIRYVRARPDVDAGKVILLGQSLGGAMAVVAAANDKIPKLAGVVVDCPFASYADVGAHVLRQSGASSGLTGSANLLVSDRHAPEKYVARVRPTPLLIMHSRDDRVVPYSHGERLFAKAREPKKLLTIESGGHTAALARHRAKVVPILIQHFREWTN